MNSPIIERPTIQQIKEIFHDCQKVTFKKDSFLFHQGDHPNYLDLLVDGKLQIFKYDSNLNEITLHFFSPISLVAEWATINEVPYPASARFIEDSKICRMPLGLFKSKLKTNVILNHLIMYSLIQKIHFLNMTIDRGLTMDGFQRVLHFLYYSPENYLELEQTQIASMLCPETFSRILKELKIQEIIEIEKGKITIKNKEKLQSILNI
jgi:CRP/FNR family transcriptional regulator